jgi:hypothetical protein
MKKQVKFYLHHDHFEPVTYSKKTGVFGLIKKLGVNIWNGIVLVCFIMGSVILETVTLPVKLFKALLRLPETVQSLWNKFHQAKFRRAVLSFIVIALVAASGIHGLNLIAAGQDIKGKVLGTSDAGIGYLQDAKTSLESQNTAAAQANFSKALEQFRNSKETLNSTNITLKSLLTVVPQKHDADRLLNAAQLITEAAIRGTELIELTDNMKLSAVGLSGTDNQGTLLHAQTLLNESVELADKASEEINSVSISSIPEQYQGAFVAAKDASAMFQTNISSLKEVCSLLFELLLGQKNILLIFQNNNELRASGGFMGTIGNAHLQDGALASLDIRSVYDWDGQLKEKILPPLPIRAANSQWFMRDSNWFASFPQSAGRISSLYEKEGGETPDLIIAMTPDVIIDMLERTGPITLPQHGVTLSAENFIEETQTATSLNYDKTLNQPKQFLADFFPILMEKLGQNNGMLTSLEIFQQNLYKKHVLMYSRNSELQQKITAFNWGGELRATDRDFLSIVSSNLGGTKTDRFMERNAHLDSVINPDGSISDTVMYTVKNPLPQTDGLKNKSFIRIFVPEGSRLTSSSGFTNVEIPRVNESDYVLDEKVMEWQSRVTQDTATGTYTGIEAGKTWFGNWLEAAGGEEKTVKVSYTLPFRLGDLDRHSLLVQKQSGALTNQFDYTLSFAGRKSLWNSNAAQMDSSKLTYSQGLLADTFIGLVLDNN